MPDVPPQAHATILREVRELKNKLAAVGDGTHRRLHHLCFEAANVTLGQCHSAISETRDKARIVEELRRAYEALGRWLNGPAAPAVVPTREQLQKLWGRL